MELMIVLLLVLTIAGAIFQTINVTTQRSTAEQTKVDMFQEAREFMDQMTRDLRQAGYPNLRNMDPSVITAPSIAQDTRVAVGLVQVAAGDLWFEGDVDGSGTVSVVRYHYDTTGTNCPCLKRSQVAKAQGDPLANTDFQYQVEVQGVQSSNIFTAYSGGTPVGAGITVNLASGSGTTIAGVDTVQAVLSLESSTVDPQTRTKPVTTLVTTVRLNNCSQASPGQRTSCQ